MKRNKNNKGFTLIELLVTISIIAILTTVVLLALGGARNQSKYATVKSGMGQLRVQAELYFTDYGYYSNSSGTTCPTAFSVTPSNIYESEKFFRIFSKLANSVSITDLSNETMIYCARTTNSYAFVLKVDQFSSIDDFAASNSDFTLCIDSENRLHRGVGGDPVELVTILDGKYICAADKTVI